MKQVRVRDAAPENVQLPKRERAFQATVDVVPDGERLRFVNCQASDKLGGELQHGRFPLAAPTTSLRGSMSKKTNRGKHVRCLLR